MSKADSNLSIPESNCDPRFDFGMFFHQRRMVTFSNNVEPANGFLVRYLHRKLMESEDERNLTNEDLIRVLDWVPKLWYHLHTFLEKHSTSDFLIGMKLMGRNVTCNICVFWETWSRNVEQICRPKKIPSCYSRINTFTEHDLFVIENYFSERTSFFSWSLSLTSPPLSLLRPVLFPLLPRHSG